MFLNTKPASSFDANQIISTCSFAGLAIALAANEN